MIPVTLLTGFLGSGKTTLLNRLLGDPAFAGTAVIVNEFGEIGLDHELVVATTESNVVLQSGCMCCALRGDLLETLLDLGARHRAGELDFTRVMIETSGLADPAPILHTLLVHPDLGRDFFLDGVVTTVDASTARATFPRYEEARRQVALADLIVLTKTDLCEVDYPGAEQDDVGWLREELALLNPGAPVLRAIEGRLDPAALRDLGHFDAQMKAAQVTRWLKVLPGEAPAGVDPDGPGHLSGIRTISWAVAEPLTANQFDFWMDLLMARRGQDILRLKALVHLNDVPHPFVVHGVQHIFHPPVLLKDWQGTDRRSKFVMILRDFSDAEVAELFAALSALAPGAPDQPGGYLTLEVPA